MGWSIHWTVAVAALVQFGYLLASGVLATALSVEVIQLWVFSGLVGGLLTGVLISRVRFGVQWTYRGYSTIDAGVYGIAAAVLASVSFVLVLFAVNLLNTYVSKGFLAPLIFGSVFSVMALGNATVAAFSGFFGGSIGFNLGNLLSKRRSISPNGD